MCDQLEYKASALSCDQLESKASALDSIPAHPKAEALDSIPALYCTAQAFSGQAMPSISLYMVGMPTPCTKSQVVKSMIFK